MSESPDVLLKARPSPVRARCRLVTGLSLCPVEMNGAKALHVVAAHRVGALAEYL
jgi:hypothetical protein